MAYRQTANRKGIKGALKQNHCLLKQYLRSDETTLCFIVSLIVGVCAFLGVFYLVKSKITDFFDILHVLLFDIWAGLLMFLFIYAGLEPLFVR